MDFPRASFIGLCLVLDLAFVFDRAASTAFTSHTSCSLCCHCSITFGVILNTFAMASSSDELNIVTTPIFIGTTDDEGWKKYGYSDSSAVPDKPLAKKKSDVKEEEDKEKEDELVDKLSGVPLKPVSDPTPSKESLPVTSSTPDVSSSAHAADSKESLPPPAPEVNKESTPLESMEPDFSDEPKKGSVDAMEATSSAESELAQPLPRSRSRVDPLHGNKRAFALLLDGPLPDKEVLMDSKSSDALTPFMRKKSLFVAYSWGRFRFGGTTFAQEHLP